MGRKAKTLTDEQIGQIETLAAVLSLSQLADFFGMCENTFRKLQGEDRRIDEGYKKGKATAIAGVAQSLLKQAKAGNITAQIFYLKTQGKWKETHAVEVGGLDGAPLPTSVRVVLVKPDPADDPDG